jgi:hypothetical protein
LSRLSVCWWRRQWSTFSAHLLSLKQLTFVLALPPPLLRMLRQANLQPEQLLVFAFQLLAAVVAAEPWQLPAPSLSFV